MKTICTFCGHVNRENAAVCSSCGGRLFVGTRREPRKIPWTAWAPAIPVAALLFLQYAHAQKGLADFRAEEAGARARLATAQMVAARELQEKFDREQKELDTQRRELLADARVISGGAAAERHAEEWQRRQNHDPALAASLLEKTLLEVERLGKDPALNAEAALRKVAELVTPAGSRIEVTHDDKALRVRVAFRLSSVDPQEAGGVTQHNSSAELRKEIEETTARVIKDLFDYCGARGIQRLSVSCNRAILTGREPSQRLVMRSLYRAVIDADKAAAVANWRRISLGQVESMMNVEHDVISGVMITKGRRTGARVDPNEPLEF